MPCVTFCIEIIVTPSRVCELKFCDRFENEVISVTPSRVCELKCHAKRKKLSGKVTPSRVCELKYVWDETKGNDEVSHPHGCVS